MIQTATTFVTDNKRLQAIYDSAERVLLSAVASFGDRRVLTRGQSGSVMTLNSEVAGAATLSAYDPEAALNTVGAFLVAQREDGLPATVLCRGRGGILAEYDKLTGLCFCEEALSLYYLTRKKDHGYLTALLGVLLRFDSYLWEHHDLNFNKCLELLRESEAEEGNGNDRFSTIKIDYDGDLKEVSPFPIESGDLMAMDVNIRHTIARIYSLRGDEENARHWHLKAFEVQGEMKRALWVENKCACFDRDYRGSVIDSVTINNLFMMYYGAFDQPMADAFTDRYLTSPEGFWTPMPLPTVAAGEQRSAGRCHPFVGASRSMTFRRAMGALEKYGKFSLLTRLARRYLDAVAGGAFCECYHAEDGTPLPGCEGEGYSPAAATALELLARLHGIRQHLDRLYWGTMGHEDGSDSEYTLAMGGHTFRLFSEKETCSGFMGSERLFTVTAGCRVSTDLDGNDPHVANATEHELDGVLVYRNRAYSFTLAPDELLIPGETQM